MTLLRALGQLGMTLLAISCFWLMALLVAGCRIVERGIP
jgi:hypothetical protein